MRFAFIILLCLLYMFPVQAQFIRCHTMEADSLLRQKYPDIQSHADFEHWLQQAIQQQSNQKQQKVVITIPTIVHVIHNGENVGSGANISAAQVYSQYDVLNEDFRRKNADTTNTPAIFKPFAADIEIEFCPAVIDPQGNIMAEPGINRRNMGQSTWTSTTTIDNTLKPQTVWDPNKYFNIWVVNMGSSGLLGYAQFPQGSGLAGMPTGTQNANTDGIVCRHTAFGRVGNVQSPFHRGRTATHEVGHWLGLRHIWGDGGCTVDDYCNDTPRAAQSNSGCNPNANSCTDTPINYNDMVQNYMDYSNDACMNIFTNDQKTRMRTVMQNSIRRASLLTSNVCQIPNLITVSGQVLDSVTNLGIPGALVRIISTGNDYSTTANANGNFSHQVQAGTYNIYGGKWGYITNVAANLNISTSTSGVQVKLKTGYYDDFLFNFGWTVATTATTGAWVRGKPVGTFNGGVPSNPGADVPTDFGEECYITGNGGGAAGTDDVDDGVTTLTSPVFNLSSYNNPHISYYRWFYVAGGATTFNDTLVVTISNGITSAIVERIPPTYPNLSQWVNHNFTVSDFITPTANMRLSVTASDLPGTGHLVEGGLDLFRVSDSLPTNVPPVVVFSASKTVACTGEAVTFTDNSLNNPTSWNWSFPGANPPTSAVQNPIVVYSAPGVYPVTLTASNSSGSNTLTQGAFITVTPVEAGFSADKTTICSGSSVTFTDESYCNPTALYWSFPGGTPATSTQASPVVTYAAAGVYPVMLIAQNAFGADTMFNNAYINVSGGGGLPFVETFESNSFVTNGWTVQNPDNSLTWEIVNTAGNTPGGNAARVNNFSYGATGQRDALISQPFDFSTYNSVNLTFEHAYRRRATTNGDSLIVYVSTDCGATFPNKIFAGGENGTGTFATNYTLTTNFIPAAAADWCIDNAVGAACANIDLTAFAGLSSVVFKFEIYNDNGNNIYLDNINITGNQVQLPTAQFTASTPTSGCPGTVVNYQNQSSNANTLIWNFPGGSPATGTGPAPSSTYNAPGTYDVILIASNDDGNDTLVMPGYITIAAAPALSSTINDVSCAAAADGSITVSATGGTGFSYTWSTGAATATVNGLAAGTYTVTVSNGNGCSTTGSYTLTQPAALSATVNPVNASCGGTGSATAAAAGGTSPYSYAWSNGQTSATATGLSAGIYSVTISDAKGCSEVVSVTIQTANAPIVTGAAADVTCNGAATGSVSASATGGTAPYSYLWSNGATSANITGVTPGTYSVTVSDASGCIAINTFVVSQPTALNSNVSATNASCGASNGTAAVIASGGSAPYSYSWSNGQTASTATGLTAGQYTVTVTDNNLCTSVKTVSVQNTGAPSVTGTVTPVSCAGAANGAININLSGGSMPYSIQWNTGATTEDLAGVAAGQYTVTVIDNSNCATTETFTINAPAGLSLTTSSTGTTCASANGWAGVSVQGGSGPYSYLWSNGSSSNAINGIAAGNYTVTVADANGCTAAAAVQVLGTPLVQVSLSVNHISCNGSNDGAAAAVVSGGSTPYSYNWSNGSSQITIANLAAGVYTVTVTDADGCTAIQSANISQPPALQASVATGNELCGNSSGWAIVTAQGGGAPYSYAWSHGGSGTNLSAGAYTVTVTDANGCDKTVSFIINNTNNLTLNGFSTAASGGASNGTASVAPVTGTPPYQYQWNDPQQQQTSLATGLAAGIYSVTVTDANGCTAVLQEVVQTVSSIGTQSSQSGIKIYPNPSRSKVYLNFGSHPAELSAIRAYNSLGEIVFQVINPEIIKGEAVLDFSAYADGIYFIHLVSGGKVVVERVAVMK